MTTTALVVPIAIIMKPIGMSGVGGGGKVVLVVVDVFVVITTDSLIVLTSLLSCVGTNVMPLLESLLFVITMACTTKQNSISLMDISEPIECEEKRVSVKSETYDEESRKFRKHMAQREALRQLERTKTRALSVSHRLSFIR